MKIKTLEIPIYETPDGEPTCGTVEGRCMFLQVSHYGTKEWCYFDSEKQIDRGGEDGCGYLIPCKKCPLHK
jgi:hypothetical protein